MKYNPQKIEKKWQRKWEEDGLYVVKDEEKGKENYYILVEFPYPSGNLHVGHWYAFSVPDIFARAKRMQGYNVLYPFGFDAFGLPAENAAIKRGLNPRNWTHENIDYMKKQISSMGASFDASREVITCNPEYYRWTQWLFLQLFKNNLAVQKVAEVNWCPSCKTVLANEQVQDAKCERCGSEVVKKEMEQWNLKITDYADRLVDDLDDLDWPKEIKEQQKNWIGKSSGINFKHTIKDLNLSFEVYDSVPQTFHAQTFVVIAPEHPLVKEMVEGTEHEKPVFDFVEKIKKKKQSKSFDVEKEIEGVFTGRYSENYLGTGRDLPIWVASFALMEYGTGIVGCSAHDERDFRFAKKYDLPLKPVLFPEDEDLAGKVRDTEIFYREPNGILAEPAEFQGRRWDESREDIIDFIVENNLGERKTNYKLRDWTVSRQRYWGVPIPIVHCEKCGAVPVPEDELPVKLPEIEDYLPREDGKSPLAKAREWAEVECPQCGGNAERETDTLDTFVCSSWYFLAYAARQIIDNKEQITEEGIGKYKEDLKKWMPVDFYSGGAEHTTMHLLYSRFFYKALSDLGLVEGKEPYTHRMNRGLIMGPDGNKMSKSKGNVIDPDDVVKEFGADAMRLYLAFIGPYNVVGAYPWNTEGVSGVRRFLEKIWRIQDRLTTDDKQPTTNTILENLLHKTIKKVTEDIENFRFNTAISSLMILVNEMESQTNNLRQTTYDLLLILLSPFAPHIAEELWEQLGHTESIFLEEWPTWDENLIKDETITMVVQVNGKVRDKLEVPADISEDDARVKALSSERVQKFIDGKEVRKMIFVSGKLVNIVTA